MSTRKATIREKLDQPNNFIMRRMDIAQRSQPAFFEKGYVKTSLRDIANQTGISLGSLTYHFEDRSELIQFCVSQYKLQFIDDIRAACESADNIDNFINQFINIMVKAATKEAKTHSLWYQAKSQALFDDSFMETVIDIDQKLEQVISQAMDCIEQLTDKRFTLNRQQTYWALDGMFQHYLLEQINGRKKIGHRFDTEIRAFLSNIML